MTKINNAHFLNKPMLIMIASVIILYGAIFGFKIVKDRMIEKYMKAGAPVATISTTKVSYQNWQPTIKASGTLRAIYGVDVTSEIAGLLRSIHFVPGTFVSNGDVLVKLNDDQEIADLKALQAAAELAKTTYERNKEQFNVKAVSQALLDTDLADLKSKEAQTIAQAATVAKKTITAPFSGHLGIAMVNPGSYINPGDKIVTLQSLDPIYVDFTIPQQEIVQFTLGQSLTLKTDVYPELSFVGKITTIDPKIDPITRNVQVEATISNPEQRLLPGMFVEVVINAGTEKRFLTLPQTAISFNPYGEK
jgi:membrane fusion protein (multidrug efflux system)